MERTFKLFASLFAVLLTLSGCGGGGGSDAVNATINVQLTRAAATTTAYTNADQMTVTLKAPDNSTITATTNASGIASFTGQTQTGTYTVTQISGINATGQAVAFEGREFVKTAPISSAAPQIDYIPGTLPTVAVSISGAVTLNAPVPDIRKVTVNQKVNVDRLRATSAPISAAEAAAFAGRIVLTNIDFDNLYTDGLVIYNNGASKHLTLSVTDATQTITSSFYSPTGGKPTDRGNLTSGVAYPAVQLEVPSATDWALTAAGVTTAQSGDTDYNFGLLDGGGAGHEVLWFTNFGVPAGGANVKFSYEIQSFTLIP